MRAAQLDAKNGRWVQTVPQKEYYTVQECSVILDVGSPSVYSAIKRGTMKGVRINGVTHVAHDALIAYINRRGGGRRATNIGDAVIEEIRPKEESERQAVELVDAVKSETDGSGDDEEQRQVESPLDFLNEE
jgi:hypothetical protein